MIYSLVLLIFQLRRELWCRGTHVVTEDNQERKDKTQSYVKARREEDDQRG